MGGLLDSKQDAAEKNEHLGACVRCNKGVGDTELVYCDMLYIAYGRYSVCLGCLADFEICDIKDDILTDISNGALSNHPGYHGQVLNVPKQKGM